MITVLHGDEEFTRSEALAALRQEVSEEGGWGDLNVSVLEGPIDVDALRAQADPAPFLGSSRLIIVHDWLTQARSDRESTTSQLQALLAYLPHIPETSHVVFVESTLLPENHPAMSVIGRLAQEGRAIVRAFTLPPPRERREFLLRWARDRARTLGMELESQALTLLVEILGANLRLLHQELVKLRTYVGEGGVVTREDVEQLVPYTREANVFDLIVALGQRNSKMALRLLHHILTAGQHPLQILALLARQYRIYIGLKEMAEQGLSMDEMATRLHVPLWTVRRDVRVARRLSWRYLEQTMEQLQVLDERIKRGEMDPVLGLQLLVLTLCLRATP